MKHRVYLQRMGGFQPIGYFLFPFAVSDDARDVVFNIRQDDWTPARKHNTSISRDDTVMAKRQVIHLHRYTSPPNGLSDGFRLWYVKADDAESLQLLREHPDWEGFP